MEQITQNPEKTAPPPIETLSLDECWVLLEAESFGRLAVAVNGEIEIFPVNYAAYDGALYIRTAADIAVAEEAGLRPWVASTKSRHIRIRPTEVTGRSLRFGPEPEAEPDVTC